MPVYINIFTYSFLDGPFMSYFGPPAASAQFLHHTASHKQKLLQGELCLKMPIQFRVGMQSCEHM